MGQALALTALASQPASRYALQMEAAMKFNVIVHPAEEGGYWAEVPAIPGCATQGETWEELLHNLHEAVEGCLSVPVPLPLDDAHARVIEIAV